LPRVQFQRFAALINHCVVRCVSCVFTALQAGFIDAAVPDAEVLARAVALAQKLAPRGANKTILSQLKQEMYIDAYDKLTKGGCVAILFRSLAPLSDFFLNSPGALRVHNNNIDIDIDIDDDYNKQARTGRWQVWWLQEEGQPLKFVALVDTKEK
jgi:hypothetical protein